MAIETEWVHCLGCSLPVVVFPDYVEDVAVFGQEQTLTGVEHECSNENEE